MEKQRLMIIIGKRTDVVVEADLEGEEFIEGKLEGYPQEKLKECIKECNAGNLSTTLNGKHYDFTELSIHGYFKMKAVKD
jgi:hypothetical protein